METLAQVVLAAIAVANVRAYVDEGPAGVRRWWRVKLVGSDR